MTRPTTPWLRAFLEGVVIVASILLAFGIDAWWDAVQEERRAEALAESMIGDFETTRERLAVSTAMGEAVLLRGESLLRLIRSGEAVPVDSLRFLVQGVTMGIVFRPAISSYRGAEATGDLALLQRPELLDALADFDLSLEELERVRQANTDLLYSGALWTLRTRLGSLDALMPDPPGGFGVVEFDDEEYRSFLRQPSVYAALETDYIGNQSMLLGFRIADDSVVRILAELRALSRD